MPKESTIQHYTSSTTGSVPTSGNLASGELAINTADEKIFYKNHVGTVLSLSQTKDLSGAFAASSKVVSSFNGATGAVTFTVPLATTSLTGTASFNPNRFQVSATGNVDLLAAYQATGDTVITVAGSGIGIITSGKTDTLYNIGVTSFNGLTGNVSLTGDGGSSLVLGNTVVTNRIATTAATGVASFNSTYFSVSNGAVSLAAAYQATGSGIATVPLATTSLTGTASFNPNRFQVSATGNVDLLAAYQATGDTVITVAGSGIGIVTSGKTDTLYNIGVTSFNGLTGNVSLTGSGAILHTVSGTTTTLGARLATTAVTGVASFNNVRFTATTTGHIDLAAAYQVTGQTVVSGGASQLISTSGNTVTIDNRVATTSVTGVASFNSTYFTVSNGAVSLASAYQATGDNSKIASTSVTGVASFDTRFFTVGTTGHVVFSGATGDTIQAGSFINIGAGKTINNIGVQTFNGATGAVTFTVPLATTSLTGTASFNPSRFTVSATGNVDLLAAFQSTGDTVVAGDRVSIATNGKTKTISSAVPIASASTTGVASFDGSVFNVDSVGKVGLTLAYSTTGDTVITVAGSGIGIVTSGKTDTLYNIGVTSFNSLTGNISFTGDGGSSLVLGNTVVTNRIATTAATGVASFNSTYFTVSNGAVSLAAAYQATGSGIATVPLATTSLTGTASFNPNRFQVSATGNVDLLAAYQATGDTVITVAGSGIGIATSGKTDTLYNIGVTSFNGFTGNVSLTGSGAILHTVSGTTTTLGARLATTAVTGVASFNNVRFTATTTGHIDLAAAYQATGDTVITVAGSGIGIATSGKTDTLYNIGVTSFNSLTGNISFTGDGGSSLVLGNTVVTNRIATTAATGVASFNSTYFTVSNGAVSLAAAYQATGDTVITVAGSGIGIATSGKTDTLYNIGVTSFNGLTGNVSLTGDGGSSLVLGNTVVTNRLATTSVTGVASFNSTYFTVSNGAVSLASAYQTTGAAGADTQIQFNASGSLSADNGLYYTTATETLTIGSGSRRIQITPGIDNFVSALASSNLRLTQNAGNAITIGDFDGNYGGNNTYLEVYDGNSTISLYATQFNCDAAATIGYGLSASALFVSSGATFNSNVVVNGNTTLGNAASDTTTIYGTKIVNEGVYANGSLRTANISFANGQVQTLTGVGTGATGTTAIYFTDAPSSGAASVTLIVTNGGLMSGTGMTAWGGNIKWPGGIKPVLSSSGIDVVSFVTPDAGTTIYGFVGGLNFT
jgi:autotransporter family porin